MNTDFYGVRCKKLSSGYFGGVKLDDIFYFPPSLMYCLKFLYHQGVSSKRNDSDFLGFCGILGEIEQSSMCDINQELFYCIVTSI